MDGRLFVCCLVLEGRADGVDVQGMRMLEFSKHAKPNILKVLRDESFLFSFWVWVSVVYGDGAGAVCVHVMVALPHSCCVLLRVCW